MTALTRDMGGVGGTGGNGGIGGDGAGAIAEGRRVARRLTRQHGTTYYWGTAFLPRHRREDVYAIYALCRLADDIVDEPDAPRHIGLPGALPIEWPLDLPGNPLIAGPVGPSGRMRPDPRERLDAFADRFFAAWERGHDEHPLMAAIVETTHRLGLGRDCFERFFGAMRLDLTRASWSSWPELRDEYMEGSAAVIGEMMLPVLEPTTPAALGPARALGLAFQLTNFIRDVGEDLDRGRVYLPADELAAAGADPWLRRVTPQWRTFLAGQIARNRELYAEAERGLPMLPAASARCVGAALAMYSAILSRIEAADYDVFSSRARVRPQAKSAIAARVLATGSGRTAPAYAPRVPLRHVPQPGPERLASTWRLAAAPRIDRALRLARQRDPGGWYVVGASGDVPAGRSVVRRVAGREVALWRTADGELRAGAGACPHLGALLDGCAVIGSDLVCRWHGLRLPSEWPGAWPRWAAHDDGVLLWVRIDASGAGAAGEGATGEGATGEGATGEGATGEGATGVKLRGQGGTDVPALPARPAAARALAAVYTAAATCEPEDIIANRLDPWHGGWFHPYAFSHLEVDEHASSDELLVTDVTFRLGPSLGVPVRAEFACPDARTIVMTITAGEGAGSVVETHATPLGHDLAGRPVTVVTEATIAASDRPGFRAARAAAPLVRPLIRRTQGRLWADDLVYAERRYLVRTGRIAP